MLQWLAYGPTYLIVSSLSSTLLLGWLLIYDDQTTSCFHWLREPEQIKFKLAVIVYQAVHGTAPIGICLIYCAVLLTSHQDAVSGRRPPLNWSSLWRGLLPSVIGHLLLLAPRSGTLCLRTLHPRRLCWCFDENRRRICFGNLIRILYCSLFGFLRLVVLEVFTKAKSAHHEAENCCRC